MKFARLNQSEFTYSQLKRSAIFSSCDLECAQIPFASKHSHEHGHTEAARGVQPVRSRW